MAAGTQTKPAGNPRNFIEGTCTATDDTITLGGLVSHGSVSIQLTGTFTGTVTFEATTQGSTWVAFGLFPAATPSASVATTATAVGLWGDVLHGWAAVRARFSTASSGTVTVTIKSLQAQF